MPIIALGASFVRSMKSTTARSVGYSSQTGIDARRGGGYLTRSTAYALAYVISEGSTTMGSDACSSITVARPV